MAPWIIFALLYPLSYAFVNVLDKFLIEKRVKNNYAYSVVTGCLLFVSALIVWWFVELPALSSSVLFFGILSGVLYGVVYLMYFHLLTYVEVSRIIGMGYLFAAFVAILSRIFLNEQLSLLKYGMIGVAIIGTMLLSMEKREQRWKLTHIFWFMILYALLLSVVDVSDKYVLNYITFWQTYILVTIPLSLVLLLPLFNQRVRSDIKQAARNLSGIILVQLFTIAGSFSFLKAASLGKIALVSAMGTLQPVFVFAIMILLSIFVPRILKEVITPGVVLYKILGIILVVAAAIVLSL